MDGGSIGAVDDAAAVGRGAVGVHEKVGVVVEQAGNGVHCEPPARGPRYVGVVGAHVDADASRVGRVPARPPVQLEGPDVHLAPCRAARRGGRNGAGGEKGGANRRHARTYTSPYPSAGCVLRVDSKN